MSSRHEGVARIVEVGAKQMTDREAVAECVVSMTPDACARAKIEPAVTFHELRHSYASLLAQAGADLLTISKLLGHADTRVTARHYAHLTDTTLANAVNALLPSFGTVAASNVVDLANRSAA